MYKYRDASTGLMEIWRMLSKHIAEPEPLTDLESVYIAKSTSGGIHYAEEYEGQGYSYDINSMYLHYMSSHKFIIPTTQGTFSHITNADFKS